jgi:hypothetical protein
MNWYALTLTAIVTLGLIFCLVIRRGLYTDQPLAFTLPQLDRRVTGRSLLRILVHLFSYRCG